MTDMKNSMKELMEETFNGPGSEGSYYATTKPDAGIFGTLEQFSAEEASVSVHGATLAAHADHTSYYLSVVQSFLKGEEPERDWEKSWKITQVDEAEWANIQKELRAEFDAFQKTLAAGQWQADYDTNVLAALAHSAYHLGAMRQMAKVLKNPAS
jgi:hypothetical protein